jgi:sugar (pentulose or hexulose) kinase
MPKDFINFMLTGAIATDYSEASCYFLMDSESRSWCHRRWNCLA